MKFCRSTLFEAGRTLFMKNWQLKLFFKSFRRLWRTYGRQVSRKTVSCSLRFDLGVYMRRITYDSATVACSKRSDSGERCEVKKAMKSRGGLGSEVREPLSPLLLPRFYFFALLFTSHRSSLSERLEQATATVNISVFIEQRNISFQNDISLKTTRLGVLSCEKLKHCETRGRIVSLDQLCLGVEEQLLIFSASCLSPGWVKKLQKFINFCLKVGHSSNFKHSRSTWVHRPVTPVKCTKSAHRGTGTIYGSCRFDIKRFRVEPTDLRKVSTSEWQRCMSHCPQ